MVACLPDRTARGLKSSCRPDPPEQQLQRSCCWWISWRILFSEGWGKVLAVYSCWFAANGSPENESSSQFVNSGFPPVVRNAASRKRGKTIAFPHYAACPHTLQYSPGYPLSPFHPGVMFMGRLPDRYIENRLIPAYHHQ